MATNVTGDPVAISFAESDQLGDDKVVGLDVAVDSLLSAYFRHGRGGAFFCHTENDAAFAEFKTRISAAGGDPSGCSFLPTSDADGLAAVSTLFRPDPDIAGFAVIRSRRDARAYSVCGLSHTMSSLPAMATVALFVAESMQSWDAVICPSAAIRRVIEALWEAASQGAGRCPVQLPVIPLGVDAEDFAANASLGRRAEQRSALGIGDEDFAILFHGRLSYTSKAHPLPLLLAAERVAENATRPVHLVFYGYFTGDSFQADYEALARDVCQAARVHFVDNTDPRFPEAIWAAADVFASLSDNIQESFGLTPVEAMASGLPVVASDWDGYRDTVTEGVEGFLAPTLGPPPGAGVETARRYLAGKDLYGEYLAAASQSTAVDVDAVAAALGRLEASADLRRGMGEAGMRRAGEVYDWRHVIPAYEALWDELAARREQDGESGPTSEHAVTDPVGLDPFRVFAAFPTRTLAPDDRIEARPEAMQDLTRLLRHRMNMFRPDLLLPADDLPALLGKLAPGGAPGGGGDGGASVADIAAAWPAGESPRVMRTLAWLVKLGQARRRDR